MLFSYGFVFLYLGGLAWQFNLSLSRFGFSDRGGKLGSIAFIVIGAIFAVAAVVRSRAGLIRDSESLEKSLDDDINGTPEITPEERIERLRNNSGG